jgi:hypothetical protein
MSPTSWSLRVWQVASEDELARWAADPAREAQRRASDPALAVPELHRWSHRGDWRILVGELFPNERVEAAAVASEGAAYGGPLVLTDRRLLSIRERVIRSPRILSIPRGQIRSMQVREAYRYGTLHVETVGRSLDFRLIENTIAWQFVGCWLAGLDDSLGVSNPPLFAAVDDRPEPIAEPKPVVTVTAEARLRIAASGRALYLWQRPFGASLAVDKLSTTRPEDVEFQTLLDDPTAAVLVDVGVPQPREVQVGLSGWPRRRLTVTWDGQRWGRRGIAEDGSVAGPF